MRDLSQSIQREVGTRMAFLEWNENLNVGVDSINDQHKKLVGMVNDLHDAIQSGQAADALGKTLDGLIDYTKTHFAYEEKLFADTSYADSAAHKAEHDKLTATVISVQEKYKGGAGDSLSGEVMDFLKSWLVNHIQGTDKKYGPHLQAKGVK
jgi:hemerythrin